MEIALQPEIVDYTSKYGIRRLSPARRGMVLELTAWRLERFVTHNAIRMAHFIL